DVAVWAPECEESRSAAADEGIIVHRLPGRFGLPGLRTLDRALSRPGDKQRVLVQYVPQMYGWKAMNVGFCSWLRWRRDLRPWVMFHEVATPRIIGQPWRHRVLSAVTRRMAATVAHAAQRIFVSIPRWEDTLRELSGIRRPVTWLPIPSTMPTRVDANAVH